MFVLDWTKIAENYRYLFEGIKANSSFDLTNGNVDMFKDGEGSIIIKVKEGR